ncbi:hypothetical protein E2562_005848 [Oryza meyeriana var. granulata]|uniref:Fucosyltransferase n=1 Tax=Oryza meyeriana var. granulata TaxID=110450 RepID=A0A6G1CDJ2_9ORYZ|nr:hypothetical protein E2562_005848 [Oryza meyeriana var. granulata]
MQVQQRKPKACAESAAAAARGGEQQGDWLLEAAEEAQERSVPRKRKPAAAAETKRWGSVASVVLAAFVMAVPTVVVLLGARAGAPAIWIAATKALRRDSDHKSIPLARSAPDKLLGGLLPEGFDEKSCRSRYESSLYRRNPGRRPSPHLVARLRMHEELQRRCGPNTESYNRAVQRLRDGGGKGVAADAHAPDDEQCKYLVSISYRGLGNRILAAASAFLYAVLTGRVLLVDRSNEMDELFCEPFPGTTWMLPRDFPLATSYANFSADTAESYGNMLKNRVLRSTDGSDVPAAQLPAFAYLHLDHDYGDDDKMFFCDDDQRLLSNIQWLVMRTDTYIVPSLFLVTMFQEELDALFPERDAVFHHLGRYLFHPANHVWGLVARYYRAYLAPARQLVGIQVRVFDHRQAKWPHVVLDQIMSCASKEKLLPEVLDAVEDTATPPTTTPGGNNSKAILITSLRRWFYERIKAMYWERATATGEDVSVHQPSHEKYQHFGEKSHDGKAWAEMYLLSLCDVLVTSGWSTFGYVAQGLGGLRPWVMYKPTNITAVPDPPCGRDVSTEPCFHSPPFYDCKMKRGVDTGTILPHVRHCDDVSWGLKLVDPNGSAN